MRHKDDTKRAAISNAAIELITTIGFADTSMSKIASAANVSPATIYVYFENKEDMLNQLYLMAKRESSEAMLAGVEEDMPVEIAFKLIWDNFCRYMLEHPVKFAFTEQFANSPLVNRVSKEESMAYYQPMVALFERGKQQGIFKDIPLEVCAAFMIAPLMYLAKGHHAGELKLNRETLDLIFRIVWEAVTI
jgi:AcrR family transcriptional regulator